MDFIFGHIPFGVVIALLLAVLAFFIYMSIRMFNKAKKPKDEKRAKELGTVFAVSSGLIFLLFLAVIYQHYHIVKNI